MILNFRTIRGEEYQIDVDPEKNIADVKEELSSLIDYPAERIKLILLAKILKNETKISSITIPQNTFIVVHCVNDVRPVIPKSKNPEPEAEEIPESIVPPQPAPESQNSNLQPIIEQIMEMGFQKNQIEKALRNTDNDIEQAINLLINESMRPTNTQNNDGGNLFADANPNSQETQNSPLIDSAVFGQFKGQYEALSNSEKEAINRLIASRQDEAEMIIQIFIACGKDEAATLRCLE